MQRALQGACVHPQTRILAEGWQSQGAGRGLRSGARRTRRSRTTVKFDLGAGRIPLEKSVKLGGA